MKHCHISLLCNELPFLKQKLPFLYNFFSQIIFIDYNIYYNQNSTDGSIEFIENFNDPENKIILLKDYKLINNNIKNFHGAGNIHKQKMFSYGSQYINDNIDVIWATDLDEFFEYELIKDVEKLYDEDKTLISINLPHKVFVYNQYNYYNIPNLYICSRITRHIPKKIYGHCSFSSYGKYIKYTKYYLYHFALVGISRCFHKFSKIYKNNRFDHMKWIEEYKKSLNNNDKYIKIIYHNSNLYKNLYSEPYNGIFPSYINLEQMCYELNNVKI